MNVDDAGVGVDDDGGTTSRKINFIINIVKFYLYEVIVF